MYRRVGARRAAAAGWTFDRNARIGTRYVAAVVRIVALEIVYRQANPWVCACLPEGLRSAVESLVQSSFVARILDHEPLEIVIARERCQP